MKLNPFRKREAVDPFLESGSEISLAAQISSFWDETYNPNTARWRPSMVDRVWAANRCMQLTCQHIACMPLRFFGPPSATEPAWVSNPDPVWFPNGIGDALFATAWSLYGYGDAFLYVLDRYSTGFPSAWTVLDPARVRVDRQGGRRIYSIDSTGMERQQLDADRVVQITRDPRGGLRGTSALQAYAAASWNLLVSTTTSTSKMTDMPPMVLRSERKLTHEQASQLQSQWANARASTSAIPVLPPELSLESTDIGLSPADLLLLDSQKFDAATIAAAFGIPSLMLNIALEGSLVYQAPGQLFDYWWRNELYPRAKQIHNALTAQMLPKGQSVQLDARETLAPDFKDLVEAWTAMLEAGVVTGAEFRAAVLGLPPQSEAETLDDLLLPPTAAATPSANGQTALVAVQGGGT